MTGIQNTVRFLSLIEQNKGILYKVANSYCRDREDRKDLVQEIIIQLWRSFGNYDARYVYTTWMYRIALNVAISFYRKESSRKKIAHPLKEGIFNFADKDISDDRESDLGLLQQAISELRELDRALVLLYLEEKSYKEISEIMGLTETNVATKIGRIKKVLKQKFENINQ